MIRRYDDRSAIEGAKVLGFKKLCMYREFSPYANFITANFVAAVFQNYRIVASNNTCYYSENQIFYSLE